MEKGDPEMEPLLSEEAPSKTLLFAGGVEADTWKKQTKGGSSL